MFDAFQLIDDLVGVFDAQNCAAAKQFPVARIFQVKFLSRIAREVIDQHRHAGGFRDIIVILADRPRIETIVIGRCRGDRVIMKIAGVPGIDDGLIGGNGAYMSKKQGPIPIARGDVEKFQSFGLAHEETFAGTSADEESRRALSEVEIQQVPERVCVDSVLRVKGCDRGRIDLAGQISFHR